MVESSICIKMAMDSTMGRYFFVISLFIIGCALAFRPCLTPELIVHLAVKISKYLTLLQLLLQQPVTVPD